MFVHNCEIELKVTIIVNKIIFCQFFFSLMKKKILMKQEKKNKKHYNRIQVKKVNAI